MILSPKEKAEELVYKFMTKRISWRQSKLCALIAVNEILNNDKVMPYIIISYWKEVKKEIKKL